MIALCKDPATLRTELHSGHLALITTQRARLLLRRGILFQSGSSLRRCSLEHVLHVLGSSRISPLVSEEVINNCLKSLKIVFKFYIWGPGRNLLPPQVSEPLRPTVREFRFSDRHLVHYFNHLWNLHVVCFTVSIKNLSCLCARGHIRLHVLASHLNNPNVTSGTDWERQGKRPIRELITTN